MKLFQKDLFGNNLTIKKWLIRIIGTITYKRFRGINHLIIQGSEIINELPNKNVLFISNHQTYFADVMAMLHVFNASLNGRKNSIKNLSYLKNPKLNIYFLAAKETMSSGIIPKILSYTGAIPVSRTWRESGKNIQRAIDEKDIINIKLALENGWLITFPQGTTTPWAPIRKGSAYIIKESDPLIVPIVIDNFRKSFDKSGLKIKKKGIQLIIKIKKPQKINVKNKTLEEIIEKISFDIEQHSNFIK